MKIPDYVKNDEMLSDYLDELHAKEKIKGNKMLNILNDYELEDMFDEYIDDVEGQVELMGYNYYVSHLMKNTDPIAYREEYLAWIDIQVQNGVLKEIADSKYTLTNKGA